MQIYERYYKNIIKPLEENYTNIDNKLKAMKWYKFYKKSIYQKSRKKFKNKLDKHYSIYIDLILFEIFKSKKLSEQEEKNVHRMVDNAFKKLNLCIDDQTINN